MPNIRLYVTSLGLENMLEDQLFAECSFIMVFPSYFVYPRYWAMYRHGTRVPSVPTLYFCDLCRLVGGVASAVVMRHLEMKRPKLPLSCLLSLHHGWCYLGQVFVAMAHVDLRKVRLCVPKFLTLHSSSPVHCRNNGDGPLRLAYGGRFPSYAMVEKVFAFSVLAFFPNLTSGVRVNATSLAVMNNSASPVTPLDKLEAIVWLIGLIFGAIAAIATAVQAYVAYRDYSRASASQNENA